jgi:hypothetical protein
LMVRWVNMLSAPIVHISMCFYTVLFYACQAFRITCVFMLET